MHKLHAASFVAGRDTYVANIPMVQVIEQVDQLELDGSNPDAATSFIFGFFDGVLADIRLAAKNAREEMDERRPVTR